MSILGKLIAAPFRILDLPNKIMNAAVGDNDNDCFGLEAASKAVEKQVDKIIGQDETK